MVKRDYMLHQLPPPEGLQRFFDQQIVPALIDVAGALEGLLEKVSVKTRKHPVSSVAVALASGAATAIAMKWHRREAD